ncbi:MAG TPA: HAMP domain-containing histidine kinase [Thermoplasmatales archaeon]|nr:HAMP domain-containing histidine kinase [Thermoplasmatales archaeon]
MNILFPVIANLFLSIIILLISINIYTVYRRKYILWFVFALFLLPVLFIYAIFESLYLKNIWGVLFYPLIIIIAEIAVIMAQKNLLSSLKAEEGEEYRLLLREDIALIRAFGKLANYFIGRISLLVGIKSVEEILDECIEEYPILAGCYIGVDEKLNTEAMEAGMGEVVEGRMEEICEAFSYLIIKLIDLYAAMVPYGEIVDDMVKAIGRIDKKIARYFMPFILFKIILEPFLREAKGDELRALRLSADIKGIYIGRKGEIKYHWIYRFEEEEREEKFVELLRIILAIFENSEEIKKEITESFRKLPENVKENIYRYEFIKKLPKGILDEEKIVLMSKERLIEELIDRQKKLEEAYERLAEAKLDKMKSSFIDIIAHEIKTPLTAIKTYVDLMRKEKLGKLTKLQKEKLEKVAKNIEKMTKLIDDMLQIPTIDAKELELRKELFEVKDIMEKIIDDTKEMAREKKQKISVDVEPALTVFGDKNLIEKAIKNIVTNAIKYTPEKGKISIKAMREGNYAHIQISDTGKGIEKSELEKIFEPFYSRGGGAGLGLAIAKNVVESHGGKIWAESVVGKGSTFHIVLRRKRE